MELHEMDDDKLRELAKRYGIDAPRTIKDRTELMDKIETARIKHRQSLEDKAMKERKEEAQRLLGLDPQTQAKPSPETVAISNSKKVYVIFYDLEGDNADVTFTKGCTHIFHLWPEFIHVMPECVVRELMDTSTPSGKRPIHGIRPHPSIPNVDVSQIIGHRKRFNFEILDTEPPKTASFGVVLDHTLYKKLNVPYPAPISKTG